MNTSTRNFKGVWIPADVWLHEDWSIIKKALYTEVDSLDNDVGCTAGDDYLSRFLGVSPRTVRGYISELVKEGFLKKGLMPVSGTSIRVLRVIARPSNGKPISIASRKSLIATGETVLRFSEANRFIEKVEDIETHLAKFAKHTWQNLPNTPGKICQHINTVVDNSTVDINTVLNYVEFLSEAFKAFSARTSGEVQEDGALGKEVAAEESCEAPEEVFEEVMCEELTDEEQEVVSRLNSKDHKYYKDCIAVAEHFRNVANKQRVKAYTRGVYNMVVKWRKEGFSVEDICLVIDFKTWFFSEKMQRPENINLVTYLRVEKFENNHVMALEWKEKQGESVNGAGTDEKYIKFIEYLKKSPRLANYIPHEVKYLRFLKGEGEYKERFRGNESDRVSALLRAADTIAKGVQFPPTMDIVDVVIGSN